MLYLILVLTLWTNLFVHCAAPFQGYEVLPTASASSNSAGRRSSCSEPPVQESTIVTSSLTSAETDLDTTTSMDNCACTKASYATVSTTITTTSTTTAYLTSTINGSATVQTSVSISFGNATRTTLEATSATISSCKKSVISTTTNPITPQPAPSLSSTQIEASQTGEYSTEALSRSSIPGKPTTTNATMPASTYRLNENTAGRPGFGQALLAMSTLLGLLSAM